MIHAWIVVVTLMGVWSDGQTGTKEAPGLAGDFYATQDACEKNRPLIEQNERHSMADRTQQALAAGGNAQYVLARSECREVTVK